jgi:hypothetical protein
MRGIEEVKADELWIEWRTSKSRDPIDKTEKRCFDILVRPPHLSTHGYLILTSVAFTTSNSINVSTVFSSPPSHPQPLHLSKSLTLIFRVGRGLTYRSHSRSRIPCARKTREEEDHRYNQESTRQSRHGENHHHHNQHQQQGDRQGTSRLPRRIINPGLAERESRK